MPDQLTSPALSAEALALFPAAELLAATLATAPTGWLLLRPLEAPEEPGRLADLAYVHVNPAAQRLLDLPAQPTQTLLQAYPGAAESGLLAFYAEAWRSTEPRFFQLERRPGFGYHLTARRVGAGLLVNVVGTTAQPRTAVEDALHSSQLREQAARDETEQQRNRLQDLLMEAPAMICLFRGPEHVFELVNPQYQALVGPRPLLGRSVREAMPELAGQPIFDLLDRVYQTGELFRATEMLVQLDHENDGRSELEKRYYNFIYQPTHAPGGAIDGILVFAYDVTVQVVARQQTEDQEQELRHLNGRLATANDALDGLNQVLEAHVVERTHAMEAARAEAERQRARLERFFMQAPAAICVLDGPELVFELVNPVYQQLFPGRQLLGLPIGEAIPELQTQPIWQVLQGVYASGEAYEGRERLIRAARNHGGPLEDMYFNFVYQPRHDAQGRIDGIMVFAYEVTAQVRTRQQAESSVREFRLITNVIPHLVGTTSAAGEIEYCNEQWYNYIGLTPDQPASHEWARYFYPADLARMMQQWQQTQQAGQPYQGEVRLRRHDGQYRWHLVRALPLPDEQGHARRWFGTATDIHEQRELAEALRLASSKLATTNKELRQANAESQQANQDLATINQQLTRTNQALDNFVYTASHDLRQPIYNLGGIFEELKRTATFHDPEAPRLLQMFEAALHQVHGTIQGMSEVVQLERRRDAKAEAVELLPLAQEVVQTMQAQATAARACFHLDFSAVPVVHFARLDLQSILYNLLSNALKYRHPDRTPEVHVHTEVAPDGRPVLVVRDNGLGLNLARHGSELFQMFRRFHDHVGGSGLGLYLVNRVVQQAGGHLEVDSCVGAGTTFRAVLPAGLQVASPEP